MSSLFNLAKFTIGFVLAIALLFFAGVTTTRLLITRLTAPPPRPVFPNDNPSDTPQIAVTDNPEPTPSATPEIIPEPSPSLEPGAYEARVTQPIGLVVRDGPSREAGQIGGVEYDQRITVIETSPDGEWQRVRIADGALEGWVRAGNAEQVQ